MLAHTQSISKSKHLNISIINTDKWRVHFHWFGRKRRNIATIFCKYSRTHSKHIYINIIQWYRIQSIVRRTILSTKISFERRSRIIHCDVMGHNKWSLWELLYFGRLHIISTVIFHLFYDIFTTYKVRLTAIIDRPIYHPMKIVVQSLLTSMTSTTCFYQQMT